MSLDEELAKLRPADIDRPLQEVLTIMTEGTMADIMAIEDGLERRYPVLSMVGNSVIQHYLDQGRSMEQAELLAEGARLSCYFFQRYAEIELLDSTATPSWPED